MQSQEVMTVVRLKVLNLSITFKNPHAQDIPNTNDENLEGGPRHQPFLELPRQFHCAAKCSGHWVVAGTQETHQRNVANLSVDGEGAGTELSICLNQEVDSLKESLGEGLFTE